MTYFFIYGYVPPACTMVSARSDPGLAVAIDWSARKREVLAELNNNWPHHEGNQVYLDIVVGGRSEQTMRLVFALFMHEVLAVPMPRQRTHACASMTCWHNYFGNLVCGACLVFLLRASDSCGG
eukprot:6197020-Pleurochrysis_carterae.AAC.4